MKMSHVCITASLAVVFIGFAHAQIPNPGFELWTAEEPDGWATGNAAPIYVNVTKSTDAHSGSFAIKGDVVQVGPVAMAGVIQSGPEAEGFAFTDRPASVTGWYKFTSVGGDRFGVNVGLFMGGINGTPVAIAAIADPTTRSSYTQFSVPFNYMTNDIPDVCVMQFSVALPDGGTSTHVGSYFILDDLGFSGATSVSTSSPAPTQFALEQNYPNPFNPSTSIRYGLPTRSQVRLSVYNLLGQEVAVLVQAEQEAGYHDARFDAAGLSSGIYLYRLTAGSYQEVRRLVLMK